MRAGWIASFVTGCSVLLSVSSVMAGQKPEEPRRCDAEALVQALVAGDQERVDACTQALLSGEFQVRKEDIEDNRPIPDNIILRATLPKRDLQLDVGTVSEYVMCVFQIREETSALRILREVAPDLAETCTHETSFHVEKSRQWCEVCNSRPFPVGDEVVARLRKYWTERLKIRS